MNLTNPQIRKLKALGQHLEPVIFIGKQGLTDAVVAATAAALTSHELIKVKFTALKDQRHELAEQLAARTNSELVTVVGHVAVIYREHADPAQRKILG